MTDKNATLQTYASSLLPEILEYFKSEEGQKDFQKWKEEKQT